jgi:hypothetical protein
MRRSRRFLAVLLLAAAYICGSPVPRLQGADSLRVIGWNMQSDSSTTTHEADPNLLKQQMGQKKGAHL